MNTQKVAQELVRISSLLSEDIADNKDFMEEVYDVAFDMQQEWSAFGGGYEDADQRKIERWIKQTARKGAAKLARKYGIDKKTAEHYIWETYNSEI